MATRSEMDYKIMFKQSWKSGLDVLKANLIHIERKNKPTLRDRIAVVVVGHSKMCALTLQSPEATSNNMKLVHWPLVMSTFGTARRGLGGAPARPGPSTLYQI